MLATRSNLVGVGRQYCFQQQWPCKVCVGFWHGHLQIALGPRSSQEESNHSEEAILSGSC